MVKHPTFVARYVAGKPWTYRVDIKRAFGLPLMCSSAFVEYEFYGECFTTELVEGQTHAPVFNYSAIHHIDSVTEVCRVSVARCKCVLLTL